MNDEHLIGLAVGTPVPSPTDAAATAPEHDTFLAAQLSEDRRSVRIIFRFVLFLQLAFAPMDALIAGGDRLQLVRMLVLRAVLALALVWSLRWVKRARDRETLERASLTGAIIVLAGMIPLSLLRGPTSFSDTYLHVLGILLCYIWVPVSVRRTVGTLALVSLGYLIVVWGVKTSIALPMRLSYTLALIIANVLGYMLSLRRTALLNRMYRMWQEQKSVEESLGHALAAVRTLEGILPICIHCHKIRSDDGGWEVLERYVSQRTEAHFSHGLCPTCEATYYG